MSSELSDFFDSVGAEVPFQPSPIAVAHGQSNQAVAVTQLDAQRGPVSAWASAGERFWGISHSINALEPGVYKAGMASDVGVFLQPQPIQTDALLGLPDSKTESILAEITHFTTLRPAFTSRGLLYKRGVLLWGPPGSGKTSTLHLLMRLIVDELGGIALLIDHPVLAAAALRLIRKIEPNRQVIGILEDLDGLIGNHGVSEYLALLDGETQIDNIVFVATTNYPERLDKRFVDRPSRFDTVEYVGMPTAEARRAYLQHKEPLLPAATIEEMVEASAGFSIAHLREFIILTQCFGRSIQDAAQRLTASSRRPPHSEKSPDRFATGFAAVSGF